MQSEFQPGVEFNSPDFEMRQIEPSRDDRVIRLMEEILGHYNAVRDQRDMYKNLYLSSVNADLERMTTRRPERRDPGFIRLPRVRGGSPPPSV